MDDSQSLYYNVLTDRHKVESDWLSSENMLTVKIEYRLGVFVDHNTNSRLPGLGSCIFLHVWSAPGHPTAGCTAMAGEEMERIVKWLNAESLPVLVQLPQEEYARLRQAWQLPVVIWPKSAQPNLE